MRTRHAVRTFAGFTALLCLSPPRRVALSTARPTLTEGNCGFRSKVSFLRRACDDPVRLARLCRRISAMEANLGSPRSSQVAWASRSRGGVTPNVCRLDFAIREVTLKSRGFSWILFRGRIATFGFGLLPCRLECDSSRCVRAFPAAREADEDPDGRRVSWNIAAISRANR